MTLCSNAYCLLQISLRSILCAGQPLRAPQRVPRSNTSWRSQIGTKWKTNSHQRWLTVMVLRSILWSTLMDNPLSIDSASGQWNGWRSHLGKAGFGFFRRWASPWCIQSYSWFVVSKHKCRCSSSCIEHHSQANCQGCLLRVSAWVSLTFVQFVQLVQNQRFLS